MLDITIRLLAAWGRHPVHGINALVHQIPTAGLFGAPDDPDPTDVIVAGDSDSPEMAEKLDPPGYPAFGMWVDSTAKAEWKGAPATKVLVAAAYCTEFQANPLNAIRECGYFMRAGRLCFLHRYTQQSYSEQPGANYRQANGIRIMNVEKVEEARRVTQSRTKKTKMWGFLDIELIVVDVLHKLPVVASPG